MRVCVRVDAIELPLGGVAPSHFVLSVPLALLLLRLYCRWLCDLDGRIELFESRV